MPDHPSPGAARMAAGLAGALARHARRGFRRARVPTIRDRLAICSACPHWRQPDNRCGLCGCRLRVKVRWASSRCPAGKWGPEAAAPPPT